MLAGMFGGAAYADGDRMAPIVAAALDNLRAWIADGVAPPRSRIDGVAQDDNGDGIPDAIEFTQAGDVTTRWTPFVEDPSLDRFLGEQLELSAAFGFPGTVRRYAEVLAALDHEPGSLQLPYMSCRVGGYEVGINAMLVPFDDREARWKNNGQYRACLNDSLNRLAAEGLYDKRLGRSVVTGQATGNPQ
jgi:hypothetical protein